MLCKRMVTLVVGTGMVFAGSAQADERKNLWGQGRVEVVIGGGSLGGPCYDCDTHRFPRPARYPVYRDGEYFDYGEAGPVRDKELWKARAEAAREWEKDRREALREREKDSREWERERAKAEREAWREEEKLRREWEKEREKADREAWKEWSKVRQERWKR